MLKNTRH